MSGQNRKQRPVFGFFDRRVGVLIRHWEKNRGQPATKVVLASGHEYIALKTEAVKPVPLEIDVQHAVADELPAAEQDFDDFHHLK